LIVNQTLGDEFMTKIKQYDSPPTSLNHRRVTLRDIAKETGFSHVTVSRALRSNPQISEQTTLRIKAKAIEMGYHPDPMLSALANYRLANQEKPIQPPLAWINLFPTPEKLYKLEVYNQYWLGASDMARELGFQLEKFNGADLPLHRMDSIFKTRGIRGILMPPISGNPIPAELAAFPWKDYSIIRFGLSINSLDVNYISSAQVANTILAFDQIVKKGYQKIGYVGEYSRRMLFGAGYLWAQQNVPESQQLPPLFFRDEEYPRQKSMLERWVQKEQPDVIIAGIPLLLEMLTSLGYKIPEDLALAALSTYDNPINAGIDQNPREIGRVAIRSLVSQINKNNFGIPTIKSEILIEGHWVDGSMLPDRV
jgi:DNA-binding LacI/PurR family transcriptional regulator